jgi:3-hydroxyacyl-CoA dehydrogenase/enoyl-CoA hydratase/3-hydroxybutyryl-CoA epimerase
VAIINKKTILGLPEVNLGISPGFGGTQRLPKLIGLKNSLNLILSGKSIDAKKALEMGVVDELMRSEFFEEKLSLFVTEILYGVTANKYLERRNKIKNSGLLEKIPFGKNIIYNFAEKELYAKTKGNYPAPFKALQVIKKTYSHSLDEKSFACELDNFCDLVTEPIAKNLIELFFTNEMLKKEFINKNNYVYFIFFNYIV